MSPAEQRRFWSKALILGPDDCWPWQGRVRSGGRGYFQVYPKTHPKGKDVRASRIAYRLAVGPTELQVLHTCDNPLCVNPGHLWAGTPLDNMQDMDRKGRRVNSPKYGADWYAVKRNLPRGAAWHACRRAKCVGSQ